MIDSGKLSKSVRYLEEYGGICRKRIGYGGGKFLKTMLTFVFLFSIVFLEMSFIELTCVLGNL